VKYVSDVTGTTSSSLSVVSPILSKRRNTPFFVTFLPHLFHEWYINYGMAWVIYRILQFEVNQMWAPASSNYLRLEEQTPDGWYLQEVTNLENALGKVASQFSRFEVLSFGNIVRMSLQRSQ
jgi:hypothetical protein